MLMNGSKAPSRLALLAILLIISVVYFFGGLPFTVSKPFGGPPTHSAGNGKATITEDEEILKQLKLSENFEYRRQCFSAKQKKGLERSGLVNISHPLLSDDTETYILQQDDLPLPACRKSITIDVPPFSLPTGADTRPLLLGMATKLSRVGPSLPALARWLPNTGSDLMVLLVDQPDLSATKAELQSLLRKAEKLGINVLFRPYCCSEDTEGLKNFALAEPLYAEYQRRSGTKEELKWFGLIDDDTFFTSLPQFYTALTSQYSHEKETYIGALTEGHTRLSQEGFKAWGGAGIFISPPLMRLLAENSEDCKQLDTGFGDILWRDCIQNVTSPTVQLTEMKGLNQIDMWADISGWYEAAHVPLYTVHHWKSWHFHPIPIASYVTDVAGPDSFLQRYIFSDNAVLSNGFSVAQYPNGLPDLDLVELTMVEDVGITREPDKLEFAHGLGMTRPKLELGRDKIQWKLEHSVRMGDGRVRQFYVKRAGRSEGVVGGKDSLVEIEWRAG